MFGRRNGRGIPVHSAEQKIARTSTDGRFRVFADGAILDTRTSLEWYVGPDVNTTWDKARDWVAGLTAAGGGWRMPTVKELRGIYEPTKETRNGSYIYLDPVFNTTGCWTTRCWVWSGKLVDEDEKLSKAGDLPCARAFDFGYGCERCYSREHYSGRGVAVRLERRK